MTDGGDPSVVQTVAVADLRPGRQVHTGDRDAAHVACLVVYLLLRPRAGAAQSSLVGAEAAEWLMDTVLSLAVLAGFAAALGLEQAGRDDLAALADPTMITLRASGSDPRAQPERVRRVGEAFADALRQGDRDAGVAEEHRRLRGSVWDRHRAIAERLGGPDAYVVDPDCGSWGCALFAATHGGVTIEPRQGRPRVIGSPGEEANFVEISPDPPVPACVTDPRGAPVRDTPGGVEMGRAGFGECSLEVVPGDDGLTTGADGELWRSARWGVHLGVVPDAAVRRR